MKLFSILLITLTLSSCSLLNNTAKVDEVVISLRKTMCRGKCPVYSVEIYESGLLKYEGEKHVEHVGAKEMQLTKSEMKALMQAFDDADFFSFEDEYVAKITDVSTTYIFYSKNGNVKTIKDRRKAPEEVKKLEDMLSELVDQWVK